VSKRISVIGNGKMAADCIKIVKATAGVEVANVLTQPKSALPGNSLPAYCLKEAIPFLETEKINGPDALAALRDNAPDVILNINSFKIIRQAVLSIPREGVINFHNGPLPRYGGVNVCSWAIINGETRYGVTWHYVDEGIDTGAIVAQRCFDLTATETAVSLMMKCISAGTALFQEWLPLLAAGPLPGQRQDASHATYFSPKDLPNGGSVSFEWDFSQFDRFVRGLSFHPVANNFVHARSTYNERPFFIQGVARFSGSRPSAACGTVLAIERDHIVVQIKDSTVALSDLLDDEKNSVTVEDFVNRYGVAVGKRLGSERS
jgi:methionyl-tRNA formyltransferase